MEVYSQSQSTKNLLPLKDQLHSSQVASKGKDPLPSQHHQQPNYIPNPQPNSYPYSHQDTSTLRVFLNVFKLKSKCFKDLSFVNEGLIWPLRFQNPYLLQESRVCGCGLWRSTAITAPVLLSQLIPRRKPVFGIMKTILEVYTSFSV